MTKTTYTHLFRNSDPDGDTFGSMLSDPNPHTPAKRYIVLDAFTGVLCGHCWAASAIEACREVDRKTGEHHHIYENIGNENFGDRSGYLVYEAPADFCVDEDPNNPWFFRTIEKLSLVAYIATS